LNTAVVLVREETETETEIETEIEMIAPAEMTTAADREEAFLPFERSTELLWTISPPVPIGEI